MDSFLSQLVLHHFRNYTETTIACDTPFVVFTGANGAGKTNILEAISLLSPGRGFRSATAAELHQIGSPHTQWIVRSEVHCKHQLHTIATAHEKHAAKRVIKIDGDIITSQQSLLNYLHIVWFLPTMSHLFQEGMSVRRKYFDRIVYGFDREHAGRVHAYEHYMRERGKVLAMPLPDASWLDALEQKISEYTVAIAYARMDMVARLNKAATTLDMIFPHAAVTLQGDAEQWLSQGKAALEAEQYICEALYAAREGDKKSGRSQVGAHKSRFEVLFVPKRMPAEQCSTGEQKALLLSLLLAQIHAYSVWAEARPVILLDEMVAHLDSDRRQALFRVLSESGVQVFATGTDASDFSALKMHDSCFFAVAEGAVKAIK